ncbi:MAG TPA: fatty acid--CoA ligase family protein [Actinomycetota bacterium]|nr:fatty acid--CoA ligase family protein [Actinomycetota bacterium]
MNLADPIDEAIALVPSRIALFVDEDEVTFAALGDAINHVSSALVASGVVPGDRVPLVASSGLLATATVLACARIGAAAAPMSARATAGEIEIMARTAGCGGVAVAEHEATDRVVEAIGAKPLGEEILDGGEMPRRAAVSDDDVCIVLFTSGTTGVPKPVPFSHGILGGRVRAFAAPPDPAAPTLVSISCVPFHHVAGLVGVFVGLAGGNTVVLQRRFEAGAWLALAEKRRVQRVFLVPTMLHRIIDHPGAARADLSAVQLVTYGAAPATPELIARARTFMPGAVFMQVFGQTETLGGVVALGPGDETAAEKGSVGKAMAGVEVRVVDPATGEDVPDGEVGEFWARAPHTATPGWIRSGDLVRRDPDGYLYAVGRMSDVINRGGEKIDPAEVEEALRAHPSVADAAVAGYPDADLGENVGAVIVTSGDVDENELRAHVRARLAPYKVPARIVFVAEIPLTELGKVSRRDLRDLLDHG